MQSQCLTHIPDVAAKNAAVCLRVFAELSPENRTDRDPQSPTSFPLTVPDHHSFCSLWMEDKEPRRQAAPMAEKTRKATIGPVGWAIGCLVY